MGSFMSTKSADTVGGSESFIKAVATFGSTIEEFKTPERPRESAKLPEAYALQGLLRKKGKFFWNERIVKLSSEGVLTYFHHDKPTRAKAAIKLSDPSVLSIRFMYAGKSKSKQVPLVPPHADDEIRIQIKAETFLFRSMAKFDHSNTKRDVRALPVSAWETAIRKFAKDPQIKVSYLH
jgi:hypothetical protein